jgi:hypothetical protein
MLFSFPTNILSDRQLANSPRSCWCLLERARPTEPAGIRQHPYAKGNPANKRVGSGWYMVNLNAGQCVAKKAGTFGCKFDANGNATECGAATVNDATGEIDVVVAQ